MIIRALHPDGTCTLIDDKESIVPQNAIAIKTGDFGGGFFKARYDLLQYQPDCKWREEGYCHYPTYVIKEK